MEEEKDFDRAKLYQELDSVKDAIMLLEDKVKMIQVRQGIIERVFLFMFKDPDSLTNKVIDMWKAERKAK